jgi:hypothetical protein
MTGETMPDTPDEAGAGRGGCKHPPSRIVDQRSYYHDDGPEATMQAGGVYCICGASWPDMETFRAERDPTTPDREDEDE